MALQFETTELRWFDEFPKCRCGKVSSGILRGNQNQSFGHHCAKCATKRLKDSEKQRLRNSLPQGTANV